MPEQLPLVSSEWLVDHLQAPDLIELDASLPKPKSSAADNPLASIQIKGARFFDIDQVFSDTSSSLPHMMPAADQFQEQAQKLGINANSTLVIYDNLGVYSSPRAWWMFKAMGHDKVFVLDGGLPNWIAHHHSTEEKQIHSWNPGDFRSKPRTHCFVDSTHVLKKPG